MEFPGIVRKVALSAFVLLMTVIVSAYTNKQAVSKRICVVAVHDSSLFTLCPPSLRNSLADGGLKNLPLPGAAYYHTDASSVRFDGYRMHVYWDGRLGAFPLDLRSAITGMLKLPPAVFLQDPGILERTRPDWQELSRLAEGIGPSGWMDPGIAYEIEAEFKKNKDYLLVDSAEKADLIFLVEGIYYCYWSPEGGTRFDYMLGDDSAGFGKQLCLADIAVVVPSEIYRRNPTNAEALLATRLWEGVSLYKQDLPKHIAPKTLDLPGERMGNRYVFDGTELIHSASPKELVRQFLKKDKWPAGVPPISAAWEMVPLAASDAANGKPIQKKGDTEQPAKPIETQEAPAGEHAIRVNTTLVTVPVIARDAEGKCVPDLTQADFHLYENGVEQKIDRLISEAAPFQTALLMDISHSTSLVRSEIEGAALSFTKVSRPDDELMVISFTNKIFVESEFTRDQNPLHRAITQLRNRGGGTPYWGEDPNRRVLDPTRQMGTRLYDAVDLTVTERFDKISGRKAILLFSDGVDTGSRLASSRSTLARIEESDVLVYAIHYDTPAQRLINRDAMAGMVAAHAQGADYLEQLANQSGGRFFSASTDSGFREAFSYIAEEMGHQYTLCYYPTAPPNDSSFCRIQVTVEKPGIKIRARTGYRPVSKLTAAKR